MFRVEFRSNSRSMADSSESSSDSDSSDTSSYSPSSSSSSPMDNFFGHQHKARRASARPQPQDITLKIQECKMCHELVLYESEIFTCLCCRHLICSACVEGHVIERCSSCLKGSCGVIQRGRMTASVMLIACEECECMVCGGCSELDFARSRVLCVTCYSRDHPAQFP